MKSRRASEEPRTREKRPADSVGKEQSFVTGCASAIRPSPSDFSHVSTLKYATRHERRHGPSSRLLVHYASNLQIPRIDRNATSATLD
ncbi:hypothetical protein LENED_004530 [Lentinula edodes]|uniref:Uncharacterized protein n=1 Tax=Lentinula edodes TaxID=5353 RepID=A0A1Q3E6J3_LENED|nr:hypothetical protein LENED_004530 [Lentinula edodes]